MTTEEFDRLAKARHEVAALKRELQEAHARTTFKARQAYYDGVWIGAAIGLVTGFVLGVIATLVIV